MRVPGYRAKGGALCERPSQSLKAQIVVQLLSFIEYRRLPEVPACSLQAGRLLFGFERPAV
jgi:hypothetical protein